jgi:hypothetical protein
MPVCHAASITLDNGSIHYFGPADAHWRVPVNVIKAIGEFRSAALDDGHYLAILIDDSGAWFQAPRRAVGVDEVLSELGREWNADLELSLDRVGSVGSRVLWPPHLAGEAMFEPASPGSERSKLSSLRAELLARIGHSGI